MKKLKKDKIIGRLLIIAFSISAVIFLHQYFYTKFDLKKNGKYTIGMTTKTDRLAKGNAHLYYYFYYKGIKYNSYIIWTNPKIKVPNGKYYVKFSINNPLNNFLLEDKPVPDSINSAPFYGWDVFP